MRQGFGGDGSEDGFEDGIEGDEEEHEGAWPSTGPEEREHAIVSMWRDGILDRLTRSPSPTERRVAHRLIAEARRITGQDATK